MRLPEKLCCVLLGLNPDSPNTELKEGEIRISLRPLLVRTRWSHLPVLRTVIWVSLPTRRTATLRTGVENEDTSRFFWSAADKG